MTDPFIMKAILTISFVAVGLTLAIHSRLSRLAERDNSAHISTSES